MEIEKLTTIDHVRHLVRSLKAISNNRFTGTTIQRAQTTDFIKNSILLHQDGDELDIRLVTPSGTTTTVVVIDEGGDKSELVPYIDRYAMYNETCCSIKYMVMIPDILFESDTDIDVVISILYKTIRNYLIQIDPFVVIDYEAIKDLKQVNSYELEMDLLVLYSVYDIISEWFTCEEKEKNTIIIDCLTNKEIMSHVDEGAIDPDVLERLIKAVSEINKYIHSETSEASAYNHVFYDGHYLSFL